MAGSNYLDGEENQYGLPSPVPAGLGEQASAIVDAYLKRPEGMIYVVDANGNPAFMKGLSPTFQYKLVGAVAPGTNVVVTVLPANVRSTMVGEVIVIDRDNPDLLEAVVVTGTPAANQMMLQRVQFNHVDAAKMDLGLVITEERNLPAKRSIARYSKFPCPAILSLMGRYGYGRRSDQVLGSNLDMNLLASVQAFGGPPQWIPITISQADWSDATGEIWIPSGVLLAYYSEVKIKYVAGFVRPPDMLVRATSMIAQSLVSGGSIGGNGIKMIAAGDSRIQRFGATNMDDDTQHLLSPFIARTFY